MARRAPESVLDVAAGAIDRLKKKLLDLSLRNRLLNFRHGQASRNHVRVVDEVPEILFEKLLENAALRFRPVDLPEQEPEDERTARFRNALARAKDQDAEYLAAKAALGPRPRKQSVRQIDRDLRNRLRGSLGMPPWQPPASVEQQASLLGMNPTYDLPLGTTAMPRGARDKDIQMLLFPDVMEARLNAIRDAARTLEADAGISALYCAFGFLEWYESPDSSESHYAPLVLVPVDIERQLLNGSYVFELRGREGDVETNVALAELMRQSFGLELTWGEDATLATYFAEVQRIVRSKDKRWRVNRWLTIGLFTFDRLAMFRDLNADTWPQGNAPREHTILQQMFGGGDQGDSSAYATDHDPDSPACKRLLPFLITDANASQQSAVVDVVSGKNLVIQGPPGTGKSQTITNIIAALLGEGKSVLFVAEKMAALEVVKKRLDAASLGDFCLELHSHKTRKSEVLKALRTRLEKERPRVRQADLDSAIAERAQAQSKLNQYVQLMNEDAGDTGMTVQTILSTSCARDPVFARFASQLAAARLPNPLRVTPHRRADVSAIAVALEGEQQRIAAYGPWNTQPWRGVENRDVARHQRDAAIESLQGWRNSLTEAQAAVSLLCQVTGLTDVDSVATIQQRIRHIGAVQDPSAAVILPLLSSISEPPDRAEIKRFSFAALKHKQLRAEVAEQADVEAVLAIDAPRLTEMSATVARLGLGSLDRHQVELKSAETRRDADRVDGYVSLATALARGVGKDRLDPRALDASCTCVQVTAQIPRHLLWLREQAIVAEEHAAVLVAAAERATQIRADAETLRKHLALPLAPPASSLRDAERVIRGGAGIWSWLFDRQYRRALRVHRSLLIAPRRVTPQTAAADLGQLAGHLEAVVVFNADDTVRTACGTKFQGVDTTFGDLLQVSNWAARIRDATTLAPEIRAFLLTGAVEQLQGVLALAQERAFAGLCEHVHNGASIDEQAKVAHKAAEELERLVAGLAAIELRPGRLLNGLTDLFRQVTEVRKTLKTLQALGRAREVLAATTPNDVSPELLLETVRFADDLEKLDLPQEITRWVLRACGSGSFEKLRNVTQGITEALGNIQLAFDRVQELLCLDAEQWCGAASFNEAPLTSLAARIDQALASPQALEALVSFLRVEDEARASGLGPVLQAFREAGREYKDLAAAFDAVFFRSASEALLEEEPSLRNHSGQKHEAIRARFQQLDQQVMKLGQQVLAARLMERDVPEGNGKGPRGTWTERALIRHQASLQKRNAPLRVLLDRAGMAIRALKPCFMMSPMSVAQYLTPGHPRFDLVVMDEASQMRPEDALGAIARGAQLVVVGDPEQLPPTTFFEKQEADIADDDEAEELGVDGQESILDLAKSSFGPLRLLNWHYRSRHAALIAFSNREFYDNRLVVFPSPREHDPMNGVNLVNTGGVYCAGRNEIEADAVIDAVLEFVRRKPDWSVAVVAMNSSQRDLIAEKLDAAFAADAVAETYRARWANGMEPLVVKNLENVQGDERDAVFISTVYGPDQAGAFAQRFGPVNLQTGHRRLNVLFTRAKHTLRIFTSMTPESIRADGASRGVRVLRDFLVYARDGHTPLQAATGGEPESEFERWFVDRLKAKGHDVVPQFGVAGYRIDLAIRHPKQPGSFILGVECDGATYHASRSARDRDRLRQEILEKLGWRLHRVWSTDWFRNPERELEIVLEKVARLQQEELVS